MGLVLSLKHWFAKPRSEASHHLIIALMLILRMNKIKGLLNNPSRLWFWQQPHKIATTLALADSLKITLIWPVARFDRLIQSPRASDEVYLYVVLATNVWYCGSVQYPEQPNDLLITIRQAHSFTPRPSRGIFFSNASTTTSTPERYKPRPTSSKARILLHSHIPSILVLKNRNFVAVALLSKPSFHRVVETPACERRGPKIVIRAYPTPNRLWSGPP